VCKVVKFAGFEDLEKLANTDVQCEMLNSKITIASQGGVVEQLGMRLVKWKVCGNVILLRV
jgi:hypothetical protein